MKKWVRYFSLLGILLVGLSTFVSAGTSVYAEDQVIDTSEVRMEEF